jgi:hypothetical protein
MNKGLQKTKSNTLKDIAVEGLHNSTGNQSGVIARLELHIEECQIFFSFRVPRLCGSGKIARLSTLMVDTRQVQKNK